MDYENAIRIKPDFADTYFYRGVGRHSEGDMNKAVADYNEAIRLAPDYAAVYLNRAYLWNQKGEYSKAIADYQKYLQIGGGERDGNQKEVGAEIKKLKNKLPKKKSVMKKAK